ncbi:UDP-N-acetylmuramoyl-tripeptide--D-alanyl-D-alanine ligase [Sulfuriferula sp. GW1]|uniref:UDP-N-acetylmuramoyl-tripeptide--D-alanyl-D- alanine ligase n=1 Tax=Sulfuriferula sp. GW1 TaxID=3345111 RepID=UPI0039B0A64C
MTTLATAAAALHARMRGTDVEFDRVATDTRTIQPGDLFVALKGGNFDGHHFAQQALDKGAVAVMIATDSGCSAHPALLVDDTRLALGQLAAWWRTQMPARLVAITGSNGKTTVKEMLASILSAASSSAAVLSTQGNFNNDIGMPLTLLRLRPQHRYGVIEMGMNHSGEIDYLTRLARPDVALVNNAGAAHVGMLGSVENVARAKGEIFVGLGEGGTAIINADDAHAGLWRALAGKHPILDFGLEHGVVRGSYRAGARGSEVTAATPIGPLQFSLRVAGEHNVRNALAATSAALALGVGASAIVNGLSEFGGVAGRLQFKPALHGATLIDDTYNANPDSVNAALAVLAAIPGKKIVVLGDMGELGEDAAAMHADIGRAARAANVNRLLALGEMSAAAVTTFGAGAMHFERIEELLAELENRLDAEVTVLVKGSRFMQMERVVKSFEVKH